MYVAVTMTTDPLEQPIEYATIAGQEMLPWLREIEGFEGLVILTNEADGSTIVLAFGRAPRGRRAPPRGPMQFRDRTHLGDERAGPGPSAMSSRSPTSGS